MPRLRIFLFLFLATFPLLIPTSGRSDPRPTRTREKSARNPDWRIVGDWAALPESPVPYHELRLGRDRVILLDLDGDGRFPEPYEDGWIPPDGKIVLPITEILPLGENGWRVLPGEEAGTVDVEAVDVPTDLAPWLRGVASLNRWRAAAGLPLVWLDPETSGWAKKHVDYLERNFGASRPDHSPHTEDPERPGYSEEGARAAREGNISYKVIPDVRLSDHIGAHLVDMQITQFLHRMDFLDPRLQTIGFAATEHWGCAVMGETNLGPEDLVGRFAPVRFPGPGQTDAPHRFESPENPNPLPEGVDFNEVGSPITLGFFRRDVRVSDVAARLVRPTGRREIEIPCYVSWPGNSAHPPWPHNKGTIALIPQSPLAQGERYRVEITATVDGERIEESWEFETTR